MSVREITKALIGKQDILFGQGAVNQTRNNTVYGIERVPLVPLVTSRAVLETLITPIDNPNVAFDVVVLLGLTVPGTDSGLFRYDGTVLKSTADGVNIITSSSISPTLGCWIRLVVDSSAKFNPITSPATPDISNYTTSTVNWTTVNLASLNGTGAKAALVKIVNSSSRSAAAAGQTQTIHLAASGKSGAASGYTNAVSELSALTSTEATAQSDICTTIVPLDGSQDFQYAIQRSGSFDTSTVEMRVIGYWK